MDIAAYAITPAIAERVGNLGAATVGVDAKTVAANMTRLGRKGGRAVLAEIDGELVGSTLYSDALQFREVSGHFGLSDEIMSYGKTLLPYYIYLRKDLLSKGISSKLRSARDADAVKHGYEYSLVMAAPNAALHAWGVREGDTELKGFADTYGRPIFIHKL